MARGRKQHRGGQGQSEVVTVTTIPESCLPGRPDAAAWQNAYADWMEASTDEEQAEALEKMRELGMQDVTGRIALR